MIFVTGLLIAVTVPHESGKRYRSRLIMKIAWTPKSMKAFKRITRRNPNIRPVIEKTLRQLAQDPFYPSLHTHKLKGNLSNIWSCSIDYSYRILFGSCAEFRRSTRSHFNC